MGGRSAVKAGLEPRPRKGSAVATRRPQTPAANARLREGRFLRTPRHALQANFRTTDTPTPRSPHLTGSPWELQPTSAWKSLASHSKQLLLQVTASSTPLALTSVHFSRSLLHRWKKPSWLLKKSLSLAAQAGPLHGTFVQVPPGCTLQFALFF